jgi:gluconolactonase
VRQSQFPHLLRSYQFNDFLALTCPSTAHACYFKIERIIEWPSAKPVGFVFSKASVLRSPTQMECVNTQLGFVFSKCDSSISHRPKMRHMRQQAALGFVYSKSLPSATLIGEVKPILAILLITLAAAAQDFNEVKVDKVAAGHIFTEGPAWSRDGYLVFTDIPNNKILQLEPGMPVSVFRSNSNGANGNTFDAQGRLYTCESHLRRVTRTDKKGKVEVLAEKWQGKRLNAPNDIVVRKDGQIYFTDPAFGNQEDSRELDFFGVFHISRRGELEPIAKPKGRPNGIAISPNGNILYVTNSDDRNVRAYDLDKNGAASNERVVVSNIDGVPDGMRVDEKGNLYVAANKLEVYSPEGKPLGSVPLAETPSNCAFGDEDFGSLYVTARTSVYRLRLNVKGSVQY